MFRVCSVFFLAGCGIVTGQAAPPTLTTLYNFSGISSGEYPHGGLIRDSKGVLYGTTVYGGTANLGLVFSLTPPAAGHTQWTYKVLYSFQGPQLGDGETPYGTVLMDSSGALYGTTVSGGAVNVGTVFRLSPPVASGMPWTEEVLYSFGGDLVNPDH